MLKEGMMEIKLFFINFKSESHLLWFFLTIFVLLVTLLLKLFFNKSLFDFLALFHAVNSIMAATYICVREDRNVYSVDCIWFNGLASLIYFSLLHFWK
jgi:hypothetical protein